MGSEDGRPDERPVHSVEVRPFRLGRTPVRRDEYELFLQTGRAEPPPCWSDPSYSAPDQPVVGVTWFEAMSFAEWLGQETGRSMRLPSEAEWERAARGGIDGGRTAWGATLPAREIPEGPLAGPWRVGQGQPNGFGLYDMGTIVHEWCLDWYRADAYAAEAPEQHPKGPEEGERRASRGGSWRHHVRWSSPAGRSSLPPTFRYADYGFRLLEEVS